MLSQLCAKIGANIDLELLEVALTHRSFAYEAGGLPTNERLEFLGDSVLGLIVTDELYKRFPDLPESRLSPLRSGIVNTKALADVARNLELGKYIRLGKGEEVTAGRDKASILADTLEALIGAVYLSEGFTKAEQIILMLLNPAIDEAVNKGAGLDGKTALQELVAARGKSAPEYSITESGPDHDKSFVAQVLISGKVTGEGQGKSKREAEQIAATKAYESLLSVSD
jgi:ribonuclease-3